MYFHIWKWVVPFNQLSWGKILRGPKANLTHSFVQIPSLALFFDDQVYDLDFKGLINLDCKLSNHDYCQIMRWKIVVVGASI